MVRRQGIVVVAPNYRLGVFGFLAHPGLTAESGGRGSANYFLPQPVSAYYAAGEQAEIPLLAGWNSSELGMSIALNPEKPTFASFKAELAKQFGTKARAAAEVYPVATDDEAMQAAADLASDLFISYSTWKWIETHLQTAGAPVYRYRFDRIPPGDAASRLGALHAVEIEYAFNTLGSKEYAWQPADFEIANVMSTAFANFVKTGDPNGPGIPRWPEFSATGKAMYFDAETLSGPEEHRERYDFLDAVDSS